MHARGGSSNPSRLYQQALAIDPNYAAAWDGPGQRLLQPGRLMACARSTRATDWRATRWRRRWRSTPMYAPAHAALGWIAMNYDGDLAAAARHIEHALALEPTNIDIIGYAATLARRLGRLDHGHRARRVSASPAIRSMPPAMPTWALHTSTPAAWTKRSMSYRTVLSLSPDAGSVH